MRSNTALHKLGNIDLSQEHKIAFLCSRKCPAAVVLKSFDWAIAQRDKGVCVISGFHSRIEKDVFYYLLQGTQPIVLVLARGMMKRWPVGIKAATALADRGARRIRSGGQARCGPRRSGRAAPSHGADR